LWAGSLKVPIPLSSVKAQVSLSCESNSPPNPLDTYQKLSVHLALRLANMKSVETSTTEALEFQTTLRIAWEKLVGIKKFKAACYRGDLALTPTCMSARGAAMVLKLGWRGYLVEPEMQELRANMKHLSSRWIIARKS
jgi:hypothetical protein